MQKRKLATNLLTPRRVLTVVIVASTFLGLFSVAWIEASRVARRRVNTAVTRLTKRLGVPIEIGSWSVTPTGASFEDLRIGPEANIVIDRLSADLALNPFGGHFGELGQVTMHRLRVKSGIKDVKGSVARLSAAGFIDDSRGLAAQRSVEKFFTALPATELELKSAVVTVLGDDGRPLLAVRGLQLVIDKDASRILFRIAGLKSTSGLADEHLQGRFEVAPDSEDYRFFIRRKTSALARTNAWAISGTVQKDLGALRVNATLSTVPSFLQSAAERLLGKRSRLKLKSEVEATREQGDTWRFAGRVQSQGSSLALPLVSTKAIGPVLFDATAKGHFDAEDRRVTVETATVAVPTRQEGRYGSAPLRFSLNGEVAAAPGELALAGQLSLPETSCQKILDASPTGLLPALVDFKLKGDAAANLDVKFTTAHPENAVFALSAARFGCQVESAPFAYSAEHLAGPFTLEKPANRDESAPISISPLSPKFAPLSGIGKTANLAFVTSEDAAFFTHNGIDTLALEGALKRNLAEKRVAVGGSTITMQTVKNLFLTRERTLSRKLQELFLAWHLENILSKDRILEIYMNIVELGPGIYGIKDASEHYFGKLPAELSPLESAYLATLLPNPKARYRYFCAGKMTPGFRELVHGVLKRMLTLGRLNYDRYLQAVQTSLHFNDDVRLSACGKEPPEESEGSTDPSPE